MRSEACVPTERAASYLQRLCRHFAHKVPVEFDAHHARVQFAMGTCEMQAVEDTLNLHVQAADTAALDRVKEIVGVHLERFAFREGLKVAWLDEAESSSF